MEELMRKSQLSCWAVVYFLILSTLPSLVHATMPSNPANDRDFTKLPGGQDLGSISVNGSRLRLARGSGHSFGMSSQAAYQKLKEQTQRDPNHPVQWVFMDLDAHRVIDQSLSSNRKIFGASVAKVFVAAALLDKQRGTLSRSQTQLMANMLVVSSNTAWTDLQRQIGDGSSDRGRAGVHDFTQRMGYARTRGYQGTWGNLHGNELTAAELADFLHDSYKNRYPGAETFWKLIHTCRTGSNRARTYIPDTMYVGGKTGTYDGPTIDPETGKSVNPDGSRYKVRVRNHVVVFNVDGREYGLAVLADTGSDESAALLAGGLLREHTRL
jgi:hypothetical protein